MDPQQQQAQVQAMHAMMAIMPIILLFGIAMAAFFIFLYWRILSKAGLSGPLALLALIPGIGPLIPLCILAFSEWKVIPAPTAYGYVPPPPAYPPTNYPPQGPTV